MNFVILILLVLVMFIVFLLGWFISSGLFFPKKFTNGQVEEMTFRTFTKGRLVVVNYDSHFLGGEYVFVLSLFGRWLHIFTEKNPLGGLPRVRGVTLGNHTYEEEYIPPELLSRAQEVLETARENFQKVQKELIDSRSQLV